MTDLNKYEKSLLGDSVSADQNAIDTLLIHVKELEDKDEKWKLLSDIQVHRLNALRGEIKRLTAKLLMLEKQDNDRGTGK